MAGQGGGGIRGSQSEACILLRRHPQCSELENVKCEFKEVTQFRKLTELFTSKWMLKNRGYICSVVSNSLRAQGLYSPGSTVHVILQVRTLEWVATSFSNA